MLSQSAAAAAARLLNDKWASGGLIDHLPEDMRPVTRAEGYAIQARLEDHFAGPVVGWKIAATSVAGQRHINVDGPLAGRIFEERLLENGQSVSLKGNNMRVAELEFAFRLGRDLAPREGGYSETQVRDAVAALHPAVELPASRYTDFCAVGAPALIADSSCGHYFLFGEAFDLSAWQGRDLKAWEVTAHIPGKGSTKGIGSNVLGDPWEALCWLVDEGSRHGLVLREGQMLSTGTCLVPVAVDEGDRLIAEFGDGVRLELGFE